MTQRYQLNNVISKEMLKNHFINNSLNNINNEFNPLYQSHIPNMNNYNYNTNQFNFGCGCNHYFGNLWPFCAFLNNQLLQQKIILNPLHIENNYNISPDSKIKENINNNNIYNLNNNNIILNQNNNINKLYEINNIYNFTNITDINELNKKNINENFKIVKNDKCFHDENNRKNDMDKNDNLQISRQFIYYCPSSTAMNNDTSKRINDSSGVPSIPTNNTIHKTINKIKKYRKNSGQIYFLKKFYDEHKHWSRKQIKEISQKIGLKESKVYKWLWDKRNKDIKAKTFIVKKDNKE